MNSIKISNLLTTNYIQEYEKEIENIKKDTLKNYIDIAKNTINYYHKKINVNTTEEEIEVIKKEALIAINNIQYGKNGYVFVISYEGISLVLPLRPDLVGKNLINVRGGGGKYTTKDLIRL
jgi:signal transduction histidine kinase